MTARKLLALAALGALASACTDPDAPAVTIGFRAPAAIVAFLGITSDGAEVKPYFAVANSARNDLTLVDAADDTPVAAPLALRAVLVPVPDRPSLLASASLADGGADLLVAVSAGDSVLQVVDTWDAANTVYSDPAGPAPAPLRAVDLGSEVVALTALPSAPETARIAAALAGRQIAVVEYARATDGSVVLVSATVGAPLEFQPIALAARPDDPATPEVDTEIYAASLDPIAPGVFGVAAVSAETLTLRAALDARAPTRLVAALRLRERTTVQPAASSRLADAFDGQPEVARVYAALDESGCGVNQRIDCGVVALDPVAGGLAADLAGVMPYRAPIPIPGRALALAVSGPPQRPPAADLTQYAGGAMRLMGGVLEQATSGVGLVASDDGRVYFLDLGRFKLVTSGSALTTATATTVGATAAGPEYGDAGRRLWVEQLLESLEAGFAFPTLSAVNATTDDGGTPPRRYLEVTPGYTRTETFTLAYQGKLPQLDARSAQAGLLAPGQLWLALQVPPPEGSLSRPTQVVKVYHPAFGIRAGANGDIAQILASAIPGCDASLTFLEARIDEILAPSDVEGQIYPGGALRIVHEPALHPDAATEALQQACFTALETALGAPTSPRLIATLRARELVLSGSALGYAGRPTLGERFDALQYVNEDEITGCPLELANWDGMSANPPACDAACRTSCEQLVLARKARRFHSQYESCTTLETATTTAVENCKKVAGDPVRLDGPALAFRAAIQPQTVGGATAPVRDLSLAIATTSGVTALSHRLTGSPYLATSAIAFDRSAVREDLAAKGYRFLVSYSADLVLDVTPHVNPVEGTVVR